MVSELFQKLYSNQYCQKYVRDVLVLFSVSVRQNTINENVSFTDYAPGIQLPDCFKLVINWKNDNDVTICWHDVIVKNFLTLFCFSCQV